MKIADCSIKDKIFQGKRFSIYRTQETNETESRIIKVLDKKTTRNYRLANELKKEYEFLKRIDSPWVIKTFGITENKDNVAVQLEDIDGISLKNYMEENSFSISEFFSLAIGITRGLDAIHRESIIHLDINAGNIIWNPEIGVLKIIDFNIASQFDLKITHLGNPDKLQGTLSYISPEQTGRMNRRVDQRTDLYSMGVTFYEMLTGRLPFPQRIPIEIVYAHLARTPEPPHVVNEQVPKALSDLVMKLMAKNPEERYQAAVGVRYDLEKLHQMDLSDSQLMKEFVLGENDFSGKLQVPEKLYGRETESKQLLDVYQQVCREGAKEMVLVKGYSGVGKTVLVYEMHKTITRDHGYFVSGKFDQLQRAVPYSAFIQALGRFCEILMTEPLEVLNLWKERIQQAVGNLGKVLTDIIPQLEAIIGRQPDIPEVGSEDAKKRFNYAFQRFIITVSTREHPLVIFIDDLQWADLASLSLLQALMQESQQCFLLFIGAYRDNEVTPAHPLMTTLEDIKKQNARIHHIPVKNLSLENVREWMSDTLNTGSRSLGKTQREGMNVAPLADLIYSKTQGNAFFTIRFLENLYQEKLLTFNFKTSRWQWDIDQIEKENITDNVVDLLIRKIRTLPEKVQEMLKLSACIGNIFDLEILGIISAGEKEQHPGLLEIAMSEQLVYPLEHERYKFVHDRIHQAAYAMIAEENKKSLHLEIGRLLLKTIDAPLELTVSETVEKHIFEIANHLNIGVDLIEEEEEKRQLALLNVKAARTAKTSAAYNHGFDYVSAAMRLLPDNCWEQHYDLALAIYNEAVQLACLCHKFQEMEVYIKTLLAFSRESAHKAVAYEYRVMGLTMQSREKEAAQEILTIFDNLGVAVPRTPSMDETMAILGQNHEALKQKGIHAIKDLPQMTDPEKKLVLRLYSIGASAIALVTPELLPIVTSKMLTLILEYGLSPEVPFILTWYGIVTAKMEDFLGAYQLGEVSLELLERGGSPETIKARSVFVASSYLIPYKKHYKEACKLLADNYPVSLNVGDIEYACYYLATIAQFITETDIDLSTIQEKIDNLMEEIENLNARHALAAGLAGVQGAYAACLLGKTPNPTQMDLSGLQEVEKNLQAGVDIFYKLKVAFKTIFLKYLFEDYDSILEDIENAQYNYNLTALHPTYDHVFTHFYFPLAYIQLYTRTRNRKKRQEYLELIKKSIDHMEQLAKFGPINYLHKFYIMQAELHRVTGKAKAAAEFYDKAVETAYENEFIHEAAIANELAAKFYEKRKQPKLATLYFMEARNSYAKWGASAKIKQLEEKYPKYLHLSVPTTTLSTGTIGSASSDTAGELLDIKSILKATQTLSGEVQLKGLLEKMIHILIENAGAQRSLLIENIDGRLLIQAEGTTDGVSGVLQALPVNESGKVPISIVNYVARSKQKLVFDNASRSANYSGDPYIQETQTKSLVCFPLLNQGKLSAIIYLENNLVEGAFTPARVEILNMLASQIAISVENTHLYENLEEKVMFRTIALQRAKEELEDNHKALEESHKKINDSVYYASRIQNAVLPNRDLLEQLLPHHFILYRPCSVVSGDFYWIKQVGGKIVVAAADCTGHGVPGALVSMLGIAFLNEIVTLLNTQAQLSASDILNQLRSLVKGALQQSGKLREQREGMDIALCVIDPIEKQLHYAGAYNPLYIITDNKITEIAANRMPIAIYRNEKAFTNHRIPFESGDMIYLFSDGYADQNGCKGEAMFTKKRFKKLLVEINQEPMARQKEILEERFDKWKGDVQQRDDVLVFGIRL